DVVDDAVAIIIAAVGGFARIAPHVGGEILVSVADAGVDDRDDDFRRGIFDGPGFSGIDIGIGSAAGLAGVAHGPEFAIGEAGIVGEDGGTDEIIGLGEFHEAAGGQFRGGGFGVLTGGKSDDLEPVEVGEGFGQGAAAVLVAAVEFGARVLV